MKGRMNKKDVDLMVKEADKECNGFINLKGRESSNEKQLLSHWLSIVSERNGLTETELL